MPTASPRLPWPLPLYPVRIPICAAAGASYAIVVAVEAWATNDPRAVLSLRCERLARGRAFPDSLLLERVPLSGLTRQAALAIFERLAALLRYRARTDAVLGEKVCPGGGKRTGKKSGAAVSRVRAETATSGSARAIRSGAKP